MAVITNTEIVARVSSIELKVGLDSPPTQTLIQSSTPTLTILGLSESLLTIVDTSVVDLLEVTR